LGLGSCCLVTRAGVFGLTGTSVAFGGFCFVSAGFVLVAATGCFLAMVVVVVGFAVCVFLTSFAVLLPLASVAPLFTTAVVFSVVVVYFGLYIKCASISEFVP